MWVVVLSVCSCSNHSIPELKTGDIVFQTSRSSQSLAVQRATGSRYSHMGIVIIQGGKPFVFEAIKTVRYTPLDKWIARGEHQHVVVKRLKNAITVLNGETLNKLELAAQQFEGRPYDLTFEWSDERIYCSELVWKLFDRAAGIHVGELQTIKDFNLDEPIVKQKLKERYGDHIPLNEPVISPVAMFNAAELETVYEQ